MVNINEPSRVERYRKRFSQISVVILILFGLLTVSRGFNSWPYEVLEQMGFLLLIIAALGRVWCSVYISGRKNQELCTLGPYQFCRNPLYLFSLLGFSGAFLALQSLSLFLVAILLYLAYYRYVILSEELRLKAIFTHEYDAYCLATPRFFPHLQNWDFSTPSRLKIVPRLLEKTLLDVFWFLGAIIAIEVIEQIHQRGYLVWGHLPF